MLNLYLVIFNAYPKLVCQTMNVMLTLLYIFYVSIILRSIFRWTYFSSSLYCSAM